VVAFSSPHAPVSLRHPKTTIPAICDLCGFKYLHRKLEWQKIWAGSALVKTGFLRCPSCLDVPNPNGRKVIRIGPDPVPVKDPRPGFLQAEQQRGAGFTTDSGWQTVTDSGLQFVDDDSLHVWGNNPPGDFMLDGSLLDGPDVLG
jgi:hypothetical protein